MDSGAFNWGLSTIGIRVTLHPGPDEHTDIAARLTERTHPGPQVHRFTCFSAHRPRFGFTTLRSVAELKSVLSISPMVITLSPVVSRDEHTWLIAHHPIIDLMFHSIRIIPHASTILYKCPITGDN